MSTDEDVIAAAVDEEMTMILNETRPKHLGAGLWSGVQAIVGGGIGATGIAILTPIQGAVRGARESGIIGGTVGALEGTVVGAVGAVNAGAGGMYLCICLCIVYSCVHACIRSVSAFKLLSCVRVCVPFILTVPIQPTLPPTITSCYAGCISDRSGSGQHSGGDHCSSSR